MNGNAFINIVNNSRELYNHDLLLEKDKPCHFIQEEVLLSFVPKKVAKMYIKNEAFKKKALANWRHHVNPMKCKMDKSFLRKILLLKLRKRYMEEYKNGYWKD